MARAYDVDDFQMDLKSEADLHSYSYCFAKKGTAEGTCAVAGAGELAIGIFRDISNISSINSPLAIKIGGIAKLKIGDTVTAGAWLKSDASGAGVPTTTDKDIVCAQAIEGGASGDIIPVLVVKFTLSV